MRSVRTTPWVAGLLAAAVLAAPAWGAGKVVRLVLDGPITEAPSPQAGLLELFGESPGTFRSLLVKIDKAAKDDEVRGIAMIIEDPQFSMAQIDELRQALASFRAKGKKVFAYIDYAGNGGYALATAADHITLAETSELGIMGLHAQVSFYKGLLDKIGVRAQMIHCGDYKAALEPYTRTEPSPAFAENINWLLDGMYQHWTQMLADGRGLSVQDIRALVDQAPIQDEKALEAKLVDAVGSFDDFRTLIHKEFGADVEIVKKYPRKEGMELELDPSNPFALFTQMNEMMEELFGGGEESDKPGIAIVYIEGGIVVGKSEMDFFSGSQVAGSTTIRAALDKVREDDRIKAVVLRVDSPGGSALASDIMWQSAMKLRDVKPVIASMGGVAGSGGYYVSIPGDVILADACSITASIGVVGGKLVWNELFADKLGITTTEFERGKHSGLMSSNRPWTADEEAQVRAWMTNIYDQFKARIKTSRGDRLKGELEDMAGGRVYTGRQALERGLIDKIGGLNDAIKLAAEKAGLTDYAVYEYPEQKGFEEVFAELMGQEPEDEWEIGRRTAVATSPLVRLAAPLLAQLAPEKLSGVIDALRNLAVLERERVGCFMPLSIEIK